MHRLLYRLSGRFKAILFLIGAGLIIFLMLYSQSIVIKLRAQSRNILEFYANILSRAVEEESHEYPVMINGKLRFKINLSLDITAEEIQQKVLQHETALKWTGGNEPKRFIHVPNKIINIVV